MQDSIIAIELLNKINNEKIVINDIRKIFNNVENAIIRNMYSDGSIMNMFDKETGDEVVTLTNKGKIIIFNDKYKDKILNFSALLEEKGYNTCYIVDYLKTCNLDDDINNILSLENFDVFIHNINLLNNNSGIARRILIKNRNIG